MKKKMNLTKSTKSTLITVGMVVVAYIIMTILTNAGALSSLMKGLLVPLCIYAIIAVALNFTVGILGELSLGHAGFMCVGAFTSAFFSLKHKEKNALVNAPTHMKPACPKLNSPKIPTVKFNATAIIA